MKLRKFLQLFTSYSFFVAAFLCSLTMAVDQTHGLDGAVVTYNLAGVPYRIAAEAGAAPEDLRVALDALTPRELDDQVNVSPDAAWLVFATERFDARCFGWACLAVVAADFSSGGAILTSSGDVIHNEGQSAVASGGNLVVYASQDGPNSMDLFAVRRGPLDWGAPVLLTGSSTVTHHTMPAISKDRLRIVFDCGPDPFSITGVGVCEVGADGSAFTQILMPDDPAAPVDTLAFHHPDYAPDGAIIVEGDVAGTESIWRISGGIITQIEQSYNNDNSPCVLPDGRIASLWLDRAGNPDGFHELKITNEDGTAPVMLVANADVADVGLGCGSPQIFADGFESGETAHWSNSAKKTRKPHATRNR